MHLRAPLAARSAGRDKQTWVDVDAYLASCHPPPDLDLDATLRACRQAGLPAIQVSPMQGRLLSMLCRLVSTRRVHEVSTLGGYSTVRLARGLSAGGRIVTLETVGDKGDVGLTIAIRS